MIFYEIINFSGVTKARIFVELTWPYFIQHRKPGPQGKVSPARGGIAGRRGLRHKA